MSALTVSAFPRLTCHPATKFFASKQPETAAPSTAAEVAPGDSNPIAQQQGSQAAAAQQATAGWPLGIPLAMHVHFSTSPDAADVFANQWSSAAGNSKSPLPHFVWENITYGDFQESRTIDLVLDVPPVGTSTHGMRICLIVISRVCRIMDRFGRTSSLSRMEPVPTRLSPTLTSGLSTMCGNVRWMNTLNALVSHVHQC